MVRRPRVLGCAVGHGHGTTPIAPARPKADVTARYFTAVSEISAAPPATFRPVLPSTLTGCRLIEEDVDMPSYAAVEPTTTNLNIDAVVLACEQAENSRVLQLQLYLLDDRRLRPSGAPSAELGDDPRAVISIDRREFPVAMLFAGAHVLCQIGLRGRSLACRTAWSRPCRWAGKWSCGSTCLCPSLAVAHRLMGRRPWIYTQPADAKPMRRCAGRTGEALRSIRGEGSSPCRVRPMGRQHLSPNCCRGSVQQGDRHHDLQKEHLRIGQRPALSPVPHDRERRRVPRLTIG